LALRGVIARPRRVAALFAGLRAYQRSGLQRVVRASRLLALAPPLARMERMLPELPDPHRAPQVVPAQGARRGRVAFLTGCVMPELFGRANAATIAVLARNGFEVEIPREQVCCGALHRHAGDPATADALHAQNRRAFHLDAVDAVIVNSAGCGAALKDTGDALGRKVRDAAEFLVDAGLREPPRALRLRVAYDDPCHLLHAQRIAAAPRALLRAIPELELFDLPGCRDCCGAAGIYNLTQPEMAATLLARKVQALRDTGPQALATGNPGCLMQIGAGVRAAGLPIEVLHPLEILARAYGD
jgi:glycolate oxidase iron-sulfur subunit